MYGLQLVAASRRRLKRGTVYVTLGRMEDKGYITSRLEEPPADAGGLPRRLYQPTALGRRVLSMWNVRRRPLHDGAGTMIRPGDRLRARAARVCRAETMERLIDPLVADLQTEHRRAFGKVACGRAVGFGSPVTSRS